MEDLHVALPAEVIRFDPSKQTVDVQFAVKIPYVTGDDDAVEWQDLGTARAIPVAFPSGGGYFMSLPLVPGDFVWVLCTDAAIGQWRVTGKSGAEGPETRLHGLGGAFAMPGARPNAKALANVSGSELRMGANTGNGRMSMTTSEVRLGASASGAAAVAGNVQSYLTALETLLGTIAAATTPPTSGAVTSFVSAQAATKNAIASTVVKVQP